jgi:hypothetical protein
MPTREPQHAMLTTSRCAHHPQTHTTRSAQPANRVTSMSLTNSSASSPPLARTPTTSRAPPRDASHATRAAGSVLDHCPASVRDAPGTTSCLDRHALLATPHACFAQVPTLTSARDATLGTRTQQPVSSPLSRRVSRHVTSTQEIISPISTKAHASSVH